METPSNELKGLAGQTLPIEGNEERVFEWLRLFLSLPIALTWPKGRTGQYGPDLLSDRHLLLKKEFKNYNVDRGDDDILAQFFVNVCVGALTVYVFHDNTAVIETEALSYSESQGHMRPSFLEGTDILGFKGSWEQVLRRLIELNDLVAKQIPEVPADLKQS